MASLVNSYFIKDFVGEQSLFNSLKIESIKIQGRTFIYIPRKIEVLDLILGEDILSKFDQTFEIEMYMQDVNGFSGENEIFSKFGLEIHSSYKLVVSQDRWKTEVGDNVVGTVISNRPQEGDLIYDPMTKFLFEIKFVDHDAEFYQLGKNYFWHLTCETFQYASENFDTGVSAIDDIELGNSFDLLDNKMLFEDGEIIYAGDCDILVAEDNTTTDTTLEYDKSYEFITAAESIEWDVNNPFSGL